MSVKNADIKVFKGNMLLLYRSLSLDSRGILDMMAVIENEYKEFRVYMIRAKNFIEKLTREVLEVINRIYIGEGEGVKANEKVFEAMQAVIKYSEVGGCGSVFWFGFIKGYIAAMKIIKKKGEVGTINREIRSIIINVSLWYIFVGNKALSFRDIIFKDICIIRNIMINIIKEKIWVDKNFIKAMGDVILSDNKVDIVNKVIQEVLVNIMGIEQYS